jgi:excisionase family DNA binding protein
MTSQPGPLDEPLLTARQVSLLLGGIPPKTVLQYAREGRLPCLRIGKHVRFVRSELDEALSAQRASRGGMQRVETVRATPAG